MTAIVLRLVLLLLPVLLVILWPRNRARQAAAGEEIDRDFSELRYILMAVLSVFIALAVSLYFFDDQKCALDTKYIPAKVVDGELQPKQCVPIDGETGSLSVPSLNQLG